MRNLTCFLIFSFRQIDPNTVKTIFILGPSHHVRLSGCAVSQCDSYKTPIGDLTINKDLTKELLDTGDDIDSQVLLRVADMHGYRQV